MDIINTCSLDSNRQNKLNFDGGELSSDAGLLLIKEFVAKVGFDKLLRSKFKTIDKAVVRFHKDHENLLQMVYQIIASYFEDNCADEIKNDPIFTAVLEKGTLASQPTLSRFFNRMDSSTLAQFDDIETSMRNVVYSIEKPKQILLDIDSTLFDGYGKQEGLAFNYHYQSVGYQ